MTTRCIFLLSEFTTVSLLAFAKEEEYAQRRFIWIRFVLLGKLGGFLTLLDFSLVSFRGIFVRIALLVFPRGAKDEIKFWSGGDLGLSCNVRC